MHRKKISPKRISISNEFNKSRSSSANRSCVLSANIGRVVNHAAKLMSLYNDHTITMIMDADNDYQSKVNKLLRQSKKPLPQLYENKTQRKSRKRKKDKEMKKKKHVTEGYSQFNKRYSSYEDVQFMNFDNESLEVVGPCAERQNSLEKSSHGDDSKTSHAASSDISESSSYHYSTEESAKSSKKYDKSCDEQKQSSDRKFPEEIIIESRMSGSISIDNSSKQMIENSSELQKNNSELGEPVEKVNLPDSDRSSSISIDEYKRKSNISRSDSNKVNDILMDSKVSETAESEKYFDFVVTKDILARDENQFNYEVEIKTTDGTDSDITLTINGELGSCTDPLYLRSFYSPDSAFQKPFQSGNRDHFQIPLKTYLGPINNITIGLDDNYEEASWYLDFVTIKDCSSGQAYMFTCHRWLGSKSPDKLNKIALVYTPPFKQMEILASPKFDMKDSLNPVENFLRPTGPILDKSDKNVQTSQNASVDNSEISKVGLKQPIQYGKTFHEAVITSDFERVKSLCDFYPDLIRTVDNNGYYPIHLAVMYYSENSESNKVLQYLISNNEDVESFCGIGYNCLHLAVMNNNMLSVQHLIRDLEVNTVAVDAYGDTALHLAVKLHMHSMVKYLESINVYDNIKNKFGKTPLDCAKEMEDDISIGLLIRDAKDSEKKSEQIQVESLNMPKDVSEDNTTLVVIQNDTSEFQKLHSEDDESKTLPIEKELPKKVDVIKLRSIPEILSRKDVLYDNQNAAALSPRHELYNEKNKTFETASFKVDSSEVRRDISKNEDVGGGFTKNSDLKTNEVEEFTNSRTLENRMNMFENENYSGSEEGYILERKDTEKRIDNNDKEVGFNMSAENYDLSTSVDKTFSLEPNRFQSPDMLEDVRNGIKTEDTDMSEGGKSGTISSRYNLEIKGKAEEKETDKDDDERTVKDVEDDVKSEVTDESEESRSSTGLETKGMLEEKRIDEANTDKVLLGTTIDVQIVDKSEDSNDKSKFGANYSGNIVVETKEGEDHLKEGKKNFVSFVETEGSKELSKDSEETKIDENSEDLRNVAEVIDSNEVMDNHELNENSKDSSTYSDDTEDSKSYSDESSGLTPDASLSSDVTYNKEIKGDEKHSRSTDGPSKTDQSQPILQENLVAKASEFNGQNNDELKNNETANNNRENEVKTDNQTISEKANDDIVESTKSTQDYRPKNNSVPNSKVSESIVQQRRFSDFGNTSSEAETLSETK